MSILFSKIKTCQCRDSSGTRIVCHHDGSSIFGHDSEVTTMTDSEPLPVIGTGSHKTITSCQPMPDVPEILVERERERKTRQHEFDTIKRSITPSNS